MRIIVPVHSDARGEQADALVARLAEVEPDADVVVLPEGDRLAGARRNEMLRGSNHPVVGFIEPEATIRRSFTGRVDRVFRDPLVLIAHCSGCLFVRNEWAVSRGGMPEDLLMGWEKEDLLRRAGQEPRRRVVVVDLPITYAEPEWSPLEKHRSAAAERRFRERWPSEVTPV